MAKIRGQGSKGRIERQGSRLCEGSGDESKAPRTKAKNEIGRQKARFFLRQDDWDEEETYIREDGERPKLPD